MNTDPTPCIEQKRFMEALGFSEDTPQLGDTSVRWSTRFFNHPVASISITLEPDDVPTANQVLYHVAEKAFNMGKRFRTRQINELLKDA